MTCPAPTDALAIWASLSPQEQDGLTTTFTLGTHGFDPQSLTWTSLARRGLATWSGDLDRWELTQFGKHVAHPPLIFLDMDGVVARVIERPRRPGESEEEWRGRQATAHERLDGAAVRRLNRIVEAIGAQFVSSSTWRLGQTPEDAASTITGWLRAKGFEGQVVGATPVLGPGRRGEEIQAWLDAQEVPPRAFAILDDWEPMGDLRSRTVYTDGDYLLSDLDVDRVIALLSPVGWAGRREPAIGRSRAGRGGDGHRLTAR